MGSVAKPGICGKQCLIYCLVYILLVETLINMLEKWIEGEARTERIISEARIEGDALDWTRDESGDRRGMVSSSPENVWKFILEAMDSGA